MTTSEPTINQQVRDEMTQLQSELEQALEETLKEAGNRLKPEEKAEITKEIEDAKELLERLKSGYVWVALFGNTSVGKSAIANSLMGEDVAKVGVEHDLTIAPTPYYKDAWAIVDVPGILGESVNQEIAISEAKRAHGHIFVIQGEPYGPELELFNLVHSELPDSPKIVFVNKWDVTEKTHTKKDVETIRTRILEKMGKFVKSPEDIVYGSALSLDQENDMMVRQDLPQVIERMYENAGTLGQVINVLDPAGRSAELNESIKLKIFQIRVKAARKVIAACSLASAFTGVVPLGEFTATPALWIGMVVAIFKIMGKQQDKAGAAKIVKEIAIACAQTLGAVFVAATAASILIDIGSTVLTPLGGVGVALGLAADVVALGVFKYRRTAILGEVTIEYIRNDFSWGAEGQAEVIKKCRVRAEEQYNYLKKNRNK
jgi:uncharacterized protein (DUF697 family)